VVEQAMYFALGFLIAALVSVPLFSAFSRRALRLTWRRLESRLPRSMEEIEAERALLCARYAFRERRWQQELDVAAAARADIMAEAGRRLFEIAVLEERLTNSEDRADVLETQLGETGRAVERTTNLLSMTRTELDALKIAKLKLDQTYETARARLQVFETRHDGEPDVEIVAKDAPSSAAEPYAPRFGGWDAWVEEVALEALPPDVAIAYLQRGAEKKDECGARTLAAALGRLPLILDLAAACCRRAPMDFSIYGTKVAALAAVAPPRKSCPPPLGAAFDLALAQAKKEAAAAEELLAFFTVCAPERVPLALIEGVAKNKAESMEAYSALVEMSVIRRALFDDGAPAAKMHPFLRSLARSRAEAADAAAAARERLIGRLLQIYPTDGYDNPLACATCAQLTPHLLAALDAEDTDAELSAGRADLMVRVASYFQGRGEYARAEPMFKSAAAIREEVFGPTHPETAASLNNLASLLCAQGDYAAARPLLERALKIFAAAFGEEYSQTLRHRASYARVLLRLGRPKEALALAEAGLAQFENAHQYEAPVLDLARVAAQALDALKRKKDATAIRFRYGVERASPEQRRSQAQRPSAWRGAALALHPSFFKIRRLRSQ
jgi:tetratricopeptide (TPR) repeat protein